MSEKKTVVHWFRKGLRIHDNPALTAAVNEVLENPKRNVLRPIFILDPGVRQWLKVRYLLRLVLNVCLRFIFDP